MLLRRWMWTESNLQLLDNDYDYEKQRKDATSMKNEIKLQFLSWGYFWLKSAFYLVDMVSPR